jgi:opacity protein-like surface antigen
MKKTIAISTILMVLSSVPAMAKTEGNYVGLDLTNARVNYEGGSSVHDDKQTSFGANYKYAFNHNNFFVAPGVFFEDLNVKSEDNVGDNWNVNYRYGAKLDLGYDFTDKFAGFVNAGVANTNYKVHQKSISQKATDDDLSGVYGVGVKYSVSNNVDLGLGYDYSEIEVKGADGSVKSPNVQVIKVGAAYKF